MTGLPILDILKAYCADRGYPAPEAEYKFCPGRKWQFDFAWPQIRLALEKEGGIFGMGKKCFACGRRKVGAHTSIQRLLSDKEKYNRAAILGWSVLRQTPKEVEGGSVFALIDEAMKEKKRLGWF